MFVINQWMVLIALLATALVVATKEKFQTAPKPKGPKHPLTSIPPRE